MRRPSMKFRATLALSCLTILVGCQAPQSITMPTKPILDVKVQTDGGMCLDAQSTERLAIYIIELERGYKP